MKKKVLLIMVALPFILSGCKRSGGEKLISISEVYDTLDEEVEKIKNTEYENLSMEHLKNVAFPKIEECAQLELIYLNENDAQSFYDMLLAAAQQWYPDLSEEELNKKTVCCFLNEESAMNNGEEESVQISLADFMNAQEEYSLENLSYGSLKYEHGNMVTTTNHVFNMQRYITRDLDTDSEIISSIYMMDEYHEAAATYKWYEFSDDTYALSNGEINIADAAAFIEDYMTNGLPFEQGEQLECDVAEISAYEIRDGLYGLQASLRWRYNEMPFDYWYMGTRVNSFSSYRGNTCVAGMVETDDLDYFFAWSAAFQVKETGTTKKILPLSTVMQHVSDAFAGQMDLDIREISFVYATDEEITKATPVWCIVAQNVTEGMTLKIYVEPVSGESSFDVYYYYLE